MSTLAVQPQNETMAGYEQALSAGEGGKVKEASVITPATEVLTGASFPVPTDGLLFKLATYISALFDRAFGTTVYDLDSVEGADSGYPICGPCCI